MIIEKQVNLTNFYWETLGNKEQIKDSKGVKVLDGEGKSSKGDQKKKGFIYLHSQSQI